MADYQYPQTPMSYAFERAQNHGDLPHVEFDDDHPQGKPAVIDGTGRQEPQETAPTEQFSGTTHPERFFSYIKSHPQATAPQLARVFNMSSEHVSSTLKGMTDAGALSRESVTIDHKRVFQYSAAMESYRSPTATERAAKARETLKKLRANKKRKATLEAKKMEGTKKTLEQVRGSAALERHVGRPSTLDSMLENLTLGELRQLRAKLNDMFGWKA